MKRLSYLTLLLLLAAPITLSVAAIPLLLNYQGNVVDGTGMAVDGTGYFKFAIVNQAGDTAYWVSSGTATDGSEPPNAVAIPVSNGAFSVKLGDTNLTNMAALTQTVFDNAAIYLRVWFSTNNINFEQFAGDIQILSTGFAFKAAVADTVLDSAVTSSSIQNNSITNIDISDTAAIAASKIDTVGLDADTLDGFDASGFALSGHNHDGVYAPLTHTHNYAGSSSPGGPANDLACTSCVGATDIAPDSVDTSKIAASAVGTSEIADGAVTAAKLATDSVDSSQIVASAVGTSEIADGGVTAAKLATRTGYLTVPSAAFRPVDSSTTFVGQTSNPYQNITGGTLAMIAPLDLPQGAIITALSMRAWDVSATNFTTVELRKFTGGASTSLISSVATTAVESSGFYIKSDTAINQTVDYSGDSHSYFYLVYKVDQAADNSGPTVYAARVTYTFK